MVPFRLPFNGQDTMANPPLIQTTFPKGKLWEKRNVRGANQISLHEYTLNPISL